MNEIRSGEQADNLSLALDNTMLALLSPYTVTHKKEDRNSRININIVEEERERQIFFKIYISLPLGRLFRGEHVWAAWHEGAITN
jgi:hypothetical protein